MIDPRDVSVRPMRVGDVEAAAAYFFDSDPAFLKSIGLRERGPDDRRALVDGWTSRIQAAAAGGPKFGVFAVEYLGKLVGIHSSTHLEEGHSLVMHAHFFDPSLRGKGIGVVSYVKAMDAFFREFSLQEILFMTPVQNAAPLRIKEKLGLQPLGEATINWPSLTGPLLTKVYRVVPGMIPALKARAGIV